ncbi:MAG TPA: ABC transporter substrate-binding protein [Pseudolabrys sp.]|jgi:NitT/TauT family transport system substrate-binding protein|nr:ABC transporter substrate-binding protein [Pseudolabrys sp.]
MQRLTKLVLGAMSCMIAASAAGPSAPVRAQDKPPAKIVFSLDFIPLGRHAPWYAAIAEGYYKAEGLDVSIIPSQGTAQTIQAVEAGTAQLGFTDVPSLVLARANGAKLKMVAVNYEKAPYAIFSLNPGANVTEAKQLEGLTLGSGAGSFTPKVIAGFMTQHGLDPKKLTISNIAPPARATALLSGQVPAIEFFVMSKPGLEAAAKAKGMELRTFLLADHGLTLYSNGIVATDDYLAKNQDVVKRFVRASLKGWQFALHNPEKAAEDQIKFVPSLNAKTSVAEIEVVKGLAVTPATEKNGLGSFDPAQMQASLDFMTKYVGVSGTPPKASDLYATGFLPSPPIKP